MKPPIEYRPKASTQGKKRVRAEPAPQAVGQLASDAAAELARIKEQTRLRVARHRERLRLKP